MWIGHNYEQMKNAKQGNVAGQQMPVENIRDPTSFGRAVGLDPDHGAADMERFGFTFGDPDHEVWGTPDPRREHTEFDNFYWPQLFPRQITYVTPHYKAI